MSKKVMKLGEHNGADEIAAKALEDAKARAIEEMKQAQARDYPRDSKGKIKAARLQMNIHPAFLDAFYFHVNPDGRRKTEDEPTMSDITLKLVYDWLEKEGVEVSPIWLLKPSKW
ncbi:hypothetical protein MPS38_003033 [Salmonella enterica]|nr:hypothetical protein [Salmonella enterica]